MRDYRNKILSVGQNSGTYLSDFVIQMIKALNINELDSIADIGCGNGTHAELLKKKFSNSNIYGVDFAPKTITYLNNNKRNIFKKIIYASTAKIPLANKSVKLALTMENLEHLYHNDIENAFKELVRISEFIIITIPIITHIVNIPWLTGEIKEAINDSIDLSEMEYESLTACVHKTGFYEESLIEAGFSKLNTEKFNHPEQGCYYGKSSNININKIKYFGIKKEEIPQNLGYKDKYIILLKKSLALNDILLK